MRVSGYESRDNIAPLGAFELTFGQLGASGQYRPNRPNAAQMISVCLSDQQTFGPQNYAPKVFQTSIPHQSSRKLYG